MSSRGPSDLSRRAFVGRVVALVGGSAVAVGSGARLLGAQQTPAGPAPATMDSSNLFAMDQMASRPVRLPPKPGARPSMTAADRDSLEHRVRCQCGCTLDVYTCRTTDFSCQVSPAMHRDVMALVEGGYSAQEILDAFVNVYGERALMAPSKEGFNLFGWVVPFVALGGGAIAVAALIRSWGRNSRSTASSVVRQDLPASPNGRVSGATAEELARLEAAVRDDA